MYKRTCASKVNFMCFFLFSMAIGKCNITYIPHFCGSHCSSFGVLVLTLERGNWNSSNYSGAKKPFS